MGNLMLKDLYLEGFAKIHSGMQIDRVYLDFQSMPHPIYLFVGNSGSGKSSILKSIHPFAFNNGTGDDTASSDLIMKGRDGKKIIRYYLDRTLITCTHLYLRKSDGTIQVKSYFQVGEEERNPSGLVSTFKELVQEYFYIDEAFLTLLALGNSVRGIVDYTAGERKKLAVRIFSELNIFMTYYKNATACVKELKTVLTNVSNKLSRYGSYDKDAIKKEIRETKKLIQLKESTLDEILKEEGGIKAKLSIHEAAYQEYSDYQGRVTSLLTQIEALKGKRHTSKDLIVLTNEKEAMTKKLIGVQLRVESLTETIQSELEFKEMKLESKKNLEDSIHRMENNLNQTELEKLLANIDGELAGLDDIELEPNVSYKDKKDELVRSAIYLDELRSMCTDLVTEVQYPELIPEVLTKFLTKKHFEQQLATTYEAVIERLNNLQNANQIRKKIHLPSINYDSCKDKDCPYKKFYQDSYTILKEKEGEQSSVLHEEEEKLHVAEQMRIIFYTLRKLYSYIDKHKQEFQIIPIKIFDPKTFVTKFMENTDRVIYNAPLLDETISYLEQATRKEELVTLRETTQNQLQGLSNTISLYDSMKVDLERINQTLVDTDKTIELHQTDLDYNQTALEDYNKTIKQLDSELEVAKELEEKRTELQTIKSGLTSMEESKRLHDILSIQLQKHQDDEYEVRGKLDAYRGTLNHLMNKLDNIQSLEEEKEMLSNQYVEANLIKDAVSPSKGIPVEFIDDIIRNKMIDSINELMHVAYPGITLLKDKDKLIIDEKEFTIPYRKNGTIVGDISEASDGERAMMSLAFSLVLIRLVSKTYNIMLLDEMDTALDKYGRSKYIDIIEQYMKTIHANQIFLISHNSMFDMYHVNVLETTENGGIDNADKHIVHVYEQNIDWIA